MYKKKKMILQNSKPVEENNNGVVRHYRIISNTNCLQGSGESGGCGGDGDVGVCG